MTKTPRLGDVFDVHDFDRVEQIYREAKSLSALIDRLVNEVVIPKLDHINLVTGQENNARCFAYLLMYYRFFGTGGPG